MNNKPLIIKTSRWRLFIYSLTGGAIFIYLAIDFLKPNTREGIANMFMVIIMVALLLFTIHFISDLIKHPSEIILTDEGIELRDQGSNLSMGKKEVIDAILAYKGSANVYYAGEERK